MGAELAPWPMPEARLVFTSKRRHPNTLMNVAWDWDNENWHIYVGIPQGHAGFEREDLINDRSAELGGTVAGIVSGTSHNAYPNGNLHKLVIYKLPKFCSFKTATRAVEALAAHLDKL